MKGNGVMPYNIMEEKVLNLLAESLDKEVEELSRDKSFIDDLGVDSLEMMELTVELENEFDISIPNEELLNIKTVGDLLDFIGEAK